MKKLFIASIISLAMVQSAVGAEDPFERNHAYAGAEATKEAYKAIYQLDTNNPDIIRKTFGNIKNLLEDTRLKGKVQVELIAFSGGTEALMKNSPYEASLRELISKGVLIAQCLNSLKVHKLERSQLYDFVAFVPSGNGELVIRGSEGWIIIKP